MNKAHLIGRITKDIELKHTQTNISYCNFTVAVNRKFKDEQGETQADFISCVAWRKLAENIAEYCGKGSHVAVVGGIQTRQYDADGVTRYVTEIVCDEVEFLTPREKPQVDGRVSAKDEPKEYVGKQERISQDEDLPF